MLAGSARAHVNNASRSRISLNHEGSISEVFQRLKTQLETLQNIALIEC